MGAQSNANALATCVEGRAQGAVMENPMGILTQALHGLGLRRQRRNWGIGDAWNAVSGAASSAYNAVAGVANSAFNAARAFGCGMGLNTRAADVCKGLVPRVVSGSESLFGSHHESLRTHWHDAVEPCLTETFTRFCDEMAAAACARRNGKKEAIAGKKAATKAKKAATKGKKA